MKMEQTQCPETSAINHHTLSNNPEDYTQHLEQGESLRSRIKYMTTFALLVITYLFTHWNKVFLEKLNNLQQVYRFPALY
jgi:hypothetical protein